METDRVTYNPMTPGYFADPYPHYADLRTDNPVHVTKFGFVMLTRWHDVIAAYDDSRLSRDTRQWDGFADWRRGVTDGPLERMMANWLVMIDPPRHTPLRAVHDRVFTRELLTGARPVVEQIVADLLEQGVTDGGTDLVGRFAEQIPVYVINHLLGLPRADWDQFVAWSKAISLTSEPMLTTKVLQAGRDALHGMYDYFGPLADKRASNPGNDVLSGLAVTEVAGQRLTREELLDSLTFLYQAGHPTGTQLIALGVLSLLKHPDQLARLREDPSLLPGAVEELQRYDGPVQMNDRVALEDLELFGLPVRQGQLVRLCLAAANRDSEHYPDADRLDVTRTVDDHLGFGRGLHYCVAAYLGTLQARIAIGELLKKTPDLRLTSAKLRFLPSASNRGLVALPVEF
ncbi:MAG TPA: cytochrome P450 [Micromonosporaceae bacterium]